MQTEEEDLNQTKSGRSLQVYGHKVSPVDEFLTCSSGFDVRIGYIR